MCALPDCLPASCDGPEDEAAPRLVAPEDGGGEEDHLNGGGVNIEAINVNDGECDASGRLVVRPTANRATDRPTDRLTAGQGQPESREENVPLLKWISAGDLDGEGEPERELFRTSDEERKRRRR